MRTCKQLAEALNKINNTINVKVVKEHGYYIIKMGGYESYNYQGFKLGGKYVVLYNS